MLYRSRRQYREITARMAMYVLHNDGPTIRTCPQRSSVLALSSLYCFERPRTIRTIGRKPTAGTHSTLTYIETGQSSRSLRLEDCQRTSVKTRRLGTLLSRVDNLPPAPLWVRESTERLPSLASTSNAMDSWPSVFYRHPLADVFYCSPTRSSSYAKSTVQVRARIAS